MVSKPRRNVGVYVTAKEAMIFLGFHPYMAESGGTVLETRKDRLCMLDSWPNRAKVLPEETEVEDEVECERVRIFAALFSDPIEFQRWIGGLEGTAG